MDSSSSTPYESAACSPRSSADRSTFSYYSVSAATRPLMITYDIRSLPATGVGIVIPSFDEEEPSSEDFDFSARFSETDPPWSSTPMSSADELFCNGQIRPLWYSCEDLVQFSSDYVNKLNSDDDDNHFDFRSSADYKFSTFSAPQSPSSAVSKLQRYVGSGYNGHSLDENSVSLHRQVSQGVKEEAGEAQRAKRIVQKWRAYSRQGQEEMIAKQAMMVKAEESRGRCAGTNKEEGVRRTRSLSPLRVFHMDDELPRQSETDQSVHLVRGDGGDEREEEQMASHKGRRMTLRELLHSSSRVVRLPSQKQGEKQQNKVHMEMGMMMKERRALWFKSSAKSSLEGSNHDSQHLRVRHQASMSPHGLHYASQMVHTEQIRQQTFLPYRRGLLGCLGFTSKSYRSVAGIRTFHSKSQGTRRSTGYNI